MHKKNNVLFLKLPQPSLADILKNQLLEYNNRLPLQCLYAMSSKAKRWILEQANYYDVILGNTVRVAPLLEVVKEKTILDFMDSFALSMKERAFVSNFIKKKFYLYESNLLESYERYVLNLFPLSIVISNRDKEYLQSLDCRIDKIKLEVIPNGVDCDYFSYTWKYNYSSDIVFLGRMDYPPNVDAVFYFVREIFPLVKQSIPNARFFVVGSSPSFSVKSLARRKDIIVTGYVRDIRSFLSKAAVFVSPLRAASGMQNKILEAMAIGTPVVASYKSFYGIQGIVHSEHLFVANDSYEYASYIVELIKDKMIANKISFNARIFVEQNYSFNVVSEKMIKLIDKFLNKEI